MNGDGMRTGVTEHQLESDGTTSTTTKTWTYDNLMRLTGEAVMSSISANSYTDTYSYDLVGNRLSKIDVANSQTETINDIFNNNEQLTNETGTGPSSYVTTFCFDTNGSMTTVSPTGSGAQSDTYSYYLQHRLSSATINHTHQA